MGVFVFLSCVRQRRRNLPGPGCRLYRHTQCKKLYRTDDYTTDNVTGLVWKTCTEGQNGSDCSGGSATTSTWTVALQYCDGLDYAGSTDWRFPSISELKSIVNRDRAAAPYIDQNTFPETAGTYWSASTVHAQYAKAWILSFGDGDTLNYQKGTGYNVRCVTDE